ncbi:DNA-directed RNA polymerases I, II, and III subunit RPABC2 [Purpureocillium lavendulum]|uniref:DNA-directed RNA polymerases I, II, and III subunit RPABC2 n=1 Tax=Purpureocillium lavendulum TaxID=1247861 RepID=A0AB34G5F2_9HYPO|nr:DNA-directed RNA polymerases I, II, and III subunit RPABC2 [Purpureocillium lavendulum]
MTPSAGAAAAVATSGPSPTTFEFVVGNRPDQLKGLSTSRLRSHVSKRGWQAHLAARRPSPPSSSSSLSPAAVPRISSDDRKADASAAARERRRKRRRGRPVFVTYELVAGPDVDPDDEVHDVVPRNQHSPLTTPSALFDPLLGGTRVDPFRAYPGPWHPSIPAWTDNYVIHMAVDISELDGPGHKGLLRSRWFPLVLSDPSVFAVILLLSAANYVSNAYPASYPFPSAGSPVSSGSNSAGNSSDEDSDGAITIYHATFSSRGAIRHHLLHMKQVAISSVNEAMRDPRRCLSDEVIGAVAKLASFEAMHGDEATYHAHMVGLRRMVELRGGMDSLGLGGLLRRIIVWIDLNSAFLLQCDRYFPGYTFTGRTDEATEPNPARFVADR